MKAARQTWWVWARFEIWLSGLSKSSSPVLFGGFLIWFIGWTVLVGVVLDAVVDEADQPLMSEGAGRLIPAVGVLFAAFVSGVVLCLNAIAVAVSLNGWVAIVIGGLVVLIALDLALVVAISDPFRGSLRVVPRPLEEVQRELEAGRFGSCR